MKYYIGIDLGGTNIAGGLVDENGKILKKISVPTEVERGKNAIIDNIADRPFYIVKGQRIAQMVLSEVPVASFYTVDSVEKFTTDRAEKGFGSRGV